jgi:hypothetical protein
MIQIIGIDGPKLGQRAHCGLERMLAARATSRLRQSSDAEIGSRSTKVRVPVDCGPDGAMDCNILELRGGESHGEDAGDILGMKIWCTRLPAGCMSTPDESRGARSKRSDGRSSAAEGRPTVGVAMGEHNKCRDSLPVATKASSAANGTVW